MSLIHTVGDVQWDSVQSIGDQVIARKAPFDMSLAANQGNNYFDGIRCPEVCMIHIMIETTVAIAATPQLWAKFSHRFGDQSFRNDPHHIIATGTNTTGAARLDLDHATIASANFCTTARVAGEYLPSSTQTVPVFDIWNKSACHIQMVSVDGTETGSQNYTLIITDLSKHFGLR